MSESVEHEPAKQESTKHSLDFPFAHAIASERPEAGFRVEFEDFCVDEELGFELAGTGEHVYLHIHKRGDNTAWVAKQIAHLAGVASMDVGYCGLKDRRAVTSQWFSVYLPKGTEPDWLALNSDSVRVAQITRHTQKLRRGQHAYNKFVIRLRDLTSPLTDDYIEKVLTQGVPNYFGEQRFGHGGENLNLADQLLGGERKIRNRQRRGLVLSASRSYLFNLVLAERVRSGTWSSMIDGDTSTGSVSGSGAKNIPDGPLWGRGRSPATGESLQLEERILSPWAMWRDAMEHMGLTQERRTLCLQPLNASWVREGADIVLSFSLLPGRYATALLRELAILKSPKPEYVISGEASVSGGEESEPVI